MIEMSRLRWLRRGRLWTAAAGLAVLATSGAAQPASRKLTIVKR